MEFDLTFKMKDVGLNGYGYKYGLDPTTKYSRFQKYLCKKYFGTEKYLLTQQTLWTQRFL